MARFKFDDVTATMELRSDRAALPWRSSGSPKCNPPGVLDKVTAVFEEHVRAGTTPSIEFTMPKLRPARSSGPGSRTYRAGYLAAFAVFGYTAISAAELRPLCGSRYCEPDAEHLRFFFHCRRDDHGY